MYPVKCIKQYTGISKYKKQHESKLSINKKYLTGWKKFV